MEPNQDGSEVHETTEEVEAETTEETSDTLSPEEIADLKRKAEASSQNFERLKKTEAELKEAREALKEGKKAPTQEGNLSPKDYLALTRAGVTDEDFDEVVRVAKILGKPIADALSDKTLKSILNERADERKTANATHTKGGARGTSKVSPEDILSKAERGETVDSAEGMQAIFQARRARMFPKK